jgi:hypothetical protein
MTEFAVFALFILFGISTLVVWPMLLHPTLPRRKKILLALAAFVLLWPGSMALYLWLGVPQLAH